MLAPGACAAAQLYWFASGTLGRAPSDVVIVMDNRTAGRPHVSVLLDRRTARRLEDPLRKPGILVERISVCAVSTALGVCTAHHYCAGAGAVQALCAGRQAPGIEPVVDRLGQALPLSMDRSSSLLIRLTKSKNETLRLKIKVAKRLVSPRGCRRFSATWPRRVESLCMG